ncbi:Nudix family hydrolase [Akkermansia muciniphila]|nr:NUDIX domain-containing protein [Akkermansia muciniphila]MBD9262229.1 NUDIX domain-containing protein [Akkermansia muciniphila]PNC45023.1 NUDIX domain-containing protein [Akkermansia muciniphila]PNC55285.1 NUDIX domain-containing protein [Akkermansia muciniphila]PNC75039.1 NUDIX domain-containing protein [Akkermansia muciniphila]
MRRLPAGQSRRTPGQDRTHRLRRPGYGNPHHQPAYPGFSRIMNTLDVCCALIELPAARGPLLLGAKKKTGQSNGLLYEFPGGKVEPGENARHAVIREIREELGCPVFPVRMLTPVRHREPERIIRLIPFLCRLELCALPRPLEHENLGFFSRRTLEELPWAPADRLVLKEWLEEHR